MKTTNDATVLSRIESIQSKGGKARAAALSAEEKSDIARKAADTRWSRKARVLSLSIPLSGGRVATIPYPMTEEDLDLLVATLQLWKRSLTQ